MINYMNTLPQKEQLYYRKLMHIIGVNDSMKQKKREGLELNNEEMFDFCRFNDRAQFNSAIQAKISAYSQAGTGNNCLHIAGEYGNINMMKFIITNRLIDTGSLNKNKDNPLFYTLKHSAHENFEKSALLLAKHTDLSQKDKDEKYVFEVDLPAYTKSRVRVLEILREQFYSKISLK